MYEAAFFDIDGTLVAHPEGEVPESALVALGELKDAGVKVVLATGRALSEMGDLDFGGFPFDGYLTLNGQLATDGDGNVLFEHPIEGEGLEELLALFDGREMPIFLVDHEGLYINMLDDHVRRVLSGLAIPMPEVSPYRQQPVLMGGAYLEPGQDELLGRLMPHLSFTHWHSSGVDILPPHSGKEVAMEAWLGSQGIALERACAFGDGENDRGMLRAAGLGVAMAEAPEDVRETADVVAPPLREDGILRVVRDHVLEP